jgi:hypothetical protein
MVAFDTSKLPLFRRSSLADPICTVAPVPTATIGTPSMKKQMKMAAWQANSLTIVALLSALN